MLLQQALFTAFLALSVPVMAETQQPDPIKTYHAAVSAFAAVTGEADGLRCKSIKPNPATVKWYVTRVLDLAGDGYAARKVAIINALGDSDVAYWVGFKDGAAACATDPETKANIRAELSKRSAAINQQLEAATAALPPDAPGAKITPTEPR